jgi:hypothetical protein
MAKKKKASRSKRRTAVGSRSKAKKTYRRGGRTIMLDDGGTRGGPGPTGGP